MKYRLIEQNIKEIVDSEANLIGDDDIPTNGSDLENTSTRTTDYNVGVGTQPFRYDMLGRFGFTLLPFFEGKENNTQQEKLLNELTDLLHDKRIELLKYYYKNPNKLKHDYRLLSKNGFKDNDDDIKLANDVIKIVQEHFDDAFDKPTTIDEDFMLDDKKIIELSDKSEDNELHDKQIKKIAGLINNLDQETIKKIANLLEVE